MKKGKNMKDHETLIKNHFIKTYYVTKEEADQIYEDDNYIYFDVYTPYDLAKEYCDMCDQLKDIPDWVIDGGYFDYEQYGKDMLTSGQWEELTDIDGFTEGYISYTK